MNCPKVAFLIPCYCEEQVLPITLTALLKLRDEWIQSALIANDSAIVLVDDGSKDATWKIISQWNEDYPNCVCGIKLSRNRGHQNALIAGLFTCKKSFDAIVTLDADLQDDISAIEEMIQKYKEGFDVVYGVRNSRATDRFFKKHTAQGFYKLMKLMGTELISDHADFRLMSQRSIEALEQFREVNLFLRGIVPMVGFPSCKVFYERQERAAGTTKYPLKKMLFFALEGITSLTVKPIRFIAFLGFSIFFISLIVIAYCLIRHFSGATVTGWTSVALSVWCIGGLQLLAIGVIGEYIGKIYLETKARPKYIIEEIKGDVFKN